MSQGTILLFFFFLGKQLFLEVPHLISFAKLNDHSNIYTHFRISENYFPVTQRFSFIFSVFIGWLLCAGHFAKSCVSFSEKHIVLGKVGQLMRKIEICEARAILGVATARALTRSSNSRIPRQNNTTPWLLQLWGLITFL